MDLTTILAVLIAMADWAVTAVIRTVDWMGTHPWSGTVTIAAGIIVALLVAALLVGPTEIRNRRRARIAARRQIPARHSDGEGVSR